MSLEDYQLVGFDSLFAELKRLAVVDWELAELEDDELPAGSEAAVAVGPVVGPQPVTQNNSATTFKNIKNFQNKACTSDQVKGIDV